MRKYVLICLFGLAWASWAWAQAPSQSAPSDTVRATKPVVNQPNAPNQSGAATPAAPEQHAGDDFDLETIEIQAVIEKPNVDIIPKRTQPEWEETRFIDRSFEAELKQAPENLMIVDDELDRAQKLDALKKADPPKKK